MKIEPLDVEFVYNGILEQHSDIHKVDALELFSRAAQADALRQVIEFLQYEIKHTPCYGYSSEFNAWEIAVKLLQSALNELENK